MTREIERKRHNVGNGPELRTGLEEDRLSSLPDDIIHHILSFIDTKFAVQTCVLSSRWKLIWTFLLHFTLESSQFRNLPKFSEFVNRVLSRRNTHTEVSTVNLNFKGRLKQNFVEKIATYAVSHNVQKINITFGLSKGDDHFPPCLFNSESLKQLSLSTTFNVYNDFPQVQFPWNLPALTTLALKNIVFCYDNAISLDLFSACVNLKYLSLDNCRARRFGVMQIFCPQQLNLTLKSVWMSKIELLTPNLTSLYYKGYHECSLSTNSLPCLDNVNLEMSTYDLIPEEYIQKEAHRLVCMLQELKDAKNLRVHVDIIEFLSTVPDILEHQPSPFSNLKCLKINFYQTWTSMNSAMIYHVIKFLVNSSSNANVIMEIPEELRLLPINTCGSHVWLTTQQINWQELCKCGSHTWLASQKINWQELCKLEEILSSQEITDPRARQALKDVKEKLTTQCRELGLPPPHWSN